MGEWLNTLPSGSGNQQANTSISASRPAGLSDDDSDYSDDDYDYDNYNSVGNHVAALPVQPQIIPQVLSHPLRHSVVRGSREDVQNCLERLENFHINDTLDGQWSALMYACNATRPEIISLLIEKGADVHNDRSLIAVACASTTAAAETVIACAQLLLAHHVDLNATDTELRATALHFAVKENKIDLVKFLLEKGAHVDALDFDNQTPLDWAASRGFGPILKMLLKYHPNIDCVNRNGITPSESAAFNDFPKTAKTLYTYQNAVNRIEVDLSALDNNEQNDDSLYETKSDRNHVEQILSHLKLSKHVDAFNNHGIDLVKFMMLTHEQMQEIGVTELGDRIKLLDTIRKIHNLDWKPTSLINFPVNSTITLPEATNFFKNVQFHLALMDATIKYVTQRSKLSDGESSLLNPGMDKKEAGRISEYCKKLVSQLQRLKQTQTAFRDYIQKIQGNAEYRLALMVD